MAWEEENKMVKKNIKIIIGLGVVLLLILVFLNNTETQEEIIGLQAASFPFLSCNKIQNLKQGHKEGRSKLSPLRKPVRLAAKKGIYK